MQKSNYRNLWGLEELLGTSNKEKTRKSASRLERSMSVEALESRVLLTVDSTLIVDPAVALEASSQSIESTFESVYSPSGSETYDLPVDTINSGSRTYEYDFTFGGNTSTTPYEVNLKVKFNTPGAVASSNFSAYVVDSSNNVIANGVIDGDSIYFNSMVQYGGTDATLVIARTANISESQTIRIYKYQCILGKIAEVSTQTGSFDKAAVTTTNSYSFSMAKGTYGSVQLYAPESQNVVVELYRGSSKIAEATSMGDGYYTIPSFCNPSSGSGTITYYVKVTGGSNVRAESYQLQVSRNGVTETETDNSIASALDIVNSNGKIYGTISGTSSEFTPSAVNTTLTASSGYGTAVAYDSSSSILVASTPKATSPAVYMYVPNATNNGWSNIGSWTKPSQCATDGQFGASLSISENWIAAGAPTDLVNGVRTGAAYVYNIKTKTTQRIVAQNESEGAKFGSNILVKGEWLFVAASSAQGGSTTSGAVYVYRLNSSNSWEYVQKLVSETTVNIAQFGYSMDCDGQTLVISAPYDSTDGTLQADGVAYLYTLRGSTWTQTQTLTLASMEELPGSSVVLTNDMQFGLSVSLDNGRLAIGCPGYKNSNVKGVVGLYKQDEAGQWNWTNTLYQASGFVGQFGTSVDLSDTQLVVGAPGMACSVYVMEYSSGNSSWTVTGTIDSDGVTNFGSRVLAAGNRIVACSPATGNSARQLIQSYTGLGDVDYYKVKITKRLGEDAVITLSPLYGLSLNNLDVCLMDGNGDIVTNAINFTSSIGGAYLTGSVELPEGYETGTYYLRIGADAGKTGAYSLTVSNITKDAFKAQLVSPAGTTPISAMPSELIFKFNEVIDFSSLSTATLNVNNKSVALSSSACTLIDGQTISVKTSSFSTMTGELSCVFSGLTSLTGSSISSDALSFTVDTTPPSLTTASHFTVDGALVAGSQFTGSAVAIPQGNVTQITLVFSSDINLPDNAAAVKRGVAIVNSVGTSIDFDLSLDLDAHTVVLTINQQLGDDTYTIQLSDDFVDMAGNKLSANSANWNFFVNSSSSISIPATTACMTDGSLMYQSSVSGAISQKNETDTFSIRIDKGNMFSVYVVPHSGSTLKASVTVKNGTSTSGSAASTRAGAPIAVEGISAKNSSNTEYTITVTGADSTTGGYTIYVVLNGMLDVSPSIITPKDLSNGTVWYSPTFASDNSSRAISYITNVVGNSVAANTNSYNLYKVQITGGSYLSVALNPGTNAGAQVGVYSNQSCAANAQIAAGTVTQSGLIAIDPIYNIGGSTATYYIKVTNVTSEFQLTAIQNGVLADAVTSDSLSQSSVFKNNLGQTYVYGHSSYLPGTITDDDLQSFAQSNPTVSVSIDGDWAAVGSQNSGSQYGNVQLYKRANNTWTLYATLSGSEFAAAGFGQSLSLKGNLLAVGAPNATYNQVACGSVLLFAFDSDEGTWTKVKTINPENYITKEGVLFGTEVSLSDGWLAVGATDDIYNGSVCGSVYMYQISGNAATFAQRLLAGKDNNVQNHDASVCQAFGTSIDIDGSWMIVGAPQDFIYNTGAAFLYYYDGVHWTQSNVISPAALEYSDGFGSQVAIDGNTIAISAPNKENAQGSGTVYLYQINGYAQSLKTLNAISSQNNGAVNFGTSLDFADNQLLVSGWKDAQQAESKVWVYLLNSDGATTQFASTSPFDGQTLVSASHDSGAIFAKIGENEASILNSLSEIQSYGITLDKAGTLNTAIIVPSSSAIGEFTNNLSASMSFTDANGTAYYTDSNFPVGTYEAEVKAAASRSGEYIYYLGYPRTAAPYLDGSFELTGFANTFNNRITAAATTIDLSFNAQVNLDTLRAALSAGKITVNGAAVASTGYTILDGKTIRLTIPSGGSAVDGKYVVKIAQGAALTDTAGRALDTTQDVTLTLLIDSVHQGAEVENVSTSSGSRTITVTFNESLLSAPAIDDVALSGAKCGTVNIEKATYIESSKKLLLVVSSLPDDYYTLVLKSSSGAFADLAGNPLDGSTATGVQDYTLNFYADWSSAQAVGYTSDNYTATFTKQSVQTSQSGYLYAGDSDAYIIQNVPAGTPLNVYVETTNGLKPTLYVYQGSSDSGELLEPEYSGQTTSGAWQYGFAQSVTSNYCVVVKNETTKNGSYTLTASLNGQKETEPIGSNNNTSAKAEPIVGLNLSNDTAVVRGTLASSTDKDWYSFTLQKGEWINLYLTKDDNNSAVMELYSNNSLILTGTQTDDFSSSILNFVETAENGSTYTVRISGEVGEYELLAAVGTVFNQDKDGAAVIAHNNSWAAGSLDKYSGYENTFILSDIVSSDALGRGAFFGSSVDVDGNWMIVGGRYANQEGISSGYAAIYAKGAAGWTEFQELTPDDLASGDQFGYAVSIKGNVAVVCSPIKDVDGIIGQAYIYEYKNGAWSLTSTLSQFGANLVFGLDCQVVNDSKVLIGSSSQAGFYIKDSRGKWVLETNSPITQNDVNTLDNYAVQGFGSSLSVNTHQSADTMVIGAPQSVCYISGSGWRNNVGMAFVYEYNAQSAAWEQSQTLSLTDSPNVSEDNLLAVGDNAGFGTEVLVYGDYVIVSAPQASYGGLDANGVVYIYKYTNGSLAYSDMLFGEQDGEMFGSSLAMNDSCLVIGSMYYSFEINNTTLLPYTGKATVFELNAFGQWTPQQDVLAGETMMGAFVGTSIALDADTLAVGAVGQRPDNELDSPRSGVVFTYSTANADDEYACYIDATKAINVIINKTDSPISELTSVKLYYRRANSTRETEAPLTATANGWRAAISSSLGSGDYVFRLVNTGETSGEYTMRLSNQGIDNTTALKVVSAAPEYGTFLDYKTQSVSVTFSDALRPDLLNLSQQPVSVFCSGAEISVKSITLSSDRKTVTVELLDSYPYKNENVQIVFKKENFVTTNGLSMATDYAIDYTIPLDVIAVTSQVMIDDAQFQIDVTFEENVALSGNAHWRDAVSFEMYYAPLDEFISWEPADLHFAYNDDTHTLTVTSSDVLAMETEYHLNLDGNIILSVSGKPLANLVDNQYVIPFIKTDASMSIYAVVSTASNASTGADGQSETIVAAEWVHEWQNFYLELWAEMDASSVGEANLIISYDSNMFAPVTQDGSFVYQSAAAFSGANGTFTVNEVNGQIIVSAQTNLDGMGADGNKVLLGRIQFAPTSNGAGVAIDAFKTGEFAATGITVSPYNLGRAKGGSAVNQNVTQTTTEVWPVIYDADDNNTVDVNDFITFATYFGSQPNKANNSWYEDYDSTNLIDVQDFIAFATNYGNSRTKGQNVSFPTDFLTKMKQRMAAAPAALPASAVTEQEAPVPQVVETIAVEPVVVELIKVESAPAPQASAPVVEQIAPIVASNSAALNATITIERSVVTEDQPQPSVSSELTSVQAAVLNDEDSLFDWDDSLADPTPVSKDPIDAALEEIFPTL